MPERILVLGTAGAGKTTVALRLAEQLQLPHVELDAWRREGGVRVPRPELIRRASVLAKQPQWVCEGIFLTWTTPLMEAADLIVWLDVSRTRAAGRVLRRAVSNMRSGSRPRLWATLRFVYSVLRPHELDAVLSSPKNLNPSRTAIKEALDGYDDTLVVVRSDGDVSEMLATLRR